MEKQIIRLLLLQNMVFSQKLDVPYGYHKNIFQIISILSDEVMDLLLYLRSEIFES